MQGDQTGGVTWEWLIDLLNSSFGSLAIVLIVLLLGITSLQDIVVRFFGGAERGILGRLFPKQYKRRDIETIVKATIRELGSDGVSSSSPQAIHFRSDEDALLRLISYLAKCTRETGGNTYGRKTINRTSYYVDTMGSVLDGRDRDLAAALARYLLARVGLPRPSFVVTPKPGNPILASTVAASLNARCIVVKGAEEASRLDAVPGATLGLEAVVVNFEGASHLSQHGKRDRTLSGIGFDCNCSGGSTLVDAIVSFNNAVPRSSSEHCTISAVKEAYVLYRADDEGELDEKFQAHGMRIHRFIDLNEEAKGKLALLGRIVAECDGDMYHTRVVSKARELLAWLSANKLVRI
jgi:hypothetical protein